MMGSVELPVPVRDHPHWRVQFCPSRYEPELIPSLAACYSTVERTKVRLRGWDYPHISHRPEQHAYGNHWVASWSEFMGHLEYWRFYQSGQFLHLFAVREATEPGWRDKLLSTTHSHLSWNKEINWSAVPGFISVTNFLYTVTEIFEFAARLAQKQVYTGRIMINIRINRIKGFVLTTDWDRAWSEYRAASEDVLGKEWEVETSDLVTASADYSLKAMVWFFERFGWLDPVISVLQKDQERFLKGVR